MGSVSVPSGPDTELQVPDEILQKIGIKTSFSKDVPKLSNNDIVLVFMPSSELVFVFSSHPFWTSSSLDVPAGVTQEEGHTGFLIHLPSAVRALIFVARRIQPFLSLVDREVEFCVLTN